MKAKKILVAFLLVFLATFIMQARAPKKDDFYVQIYHNDNLVLEKSYDINFALRLKIFFNYGGSFSKYYEEYPDDKKANFLQEINLDLHEDVQNLSKKYKKECKNAEVQSFRNGHFVYTNEEKGYQVDWEKLVKNIALSQDLQQNIILPFKSILPKTTKNDLIFRTQKVAEFSTFCENSSASRKLNIAIACKKLDNSKVLPQEELSFNKTVGKRTEENGFCKSIIIANGEFVEGVGGGVCQVSTTLFNAWARGGLVVKTSRSHSLKVAYVGVGEDAMVSETSDLVLYNDTAYPIYIDSNFDGKQIKFVIYGAKLLCEISLRNQTIKTIPCMEYKLLPNDIQDWQEGELFRIKKQPQEGLLSFTFREFYQNGELVFSEKLRTNFYTPTKGEIIYKN